MHLAHRVASSRDTPSSSATPNAVSGSASNAADRPCLVRPPTAPPWAHGPRLRRDPTGGGSTPSIVLSRSTDRSKDGHRIVPAGARKSGVRASTGRLPSTRKTTRSPDCRPSASRTAFGTVTCPFDVTMGSSECLLHRCRTPPVPSHSVELLVAANPAEDSRLPYLIRLPVGAGLVFATSDVWPRTKALYCHRLDIADSQRLRRHRGRPGGVPGRLQSTSGSRYRRHHHPAHQLVLLGE